MTTLFHVPPGLWAGKTVAVLGSGPSLTQELADSVKHLPRVCARWAAKRAPDADFAIAIDVPPNEGFWPWALENFRGQLLCGCETDALPDSIGYFWHRHERVTLSEVPSHVIEFRNNGMSAIHIAEQAGASKIILLGFDPRVNGRFYDDTKYAMDSDIGEWYHGLTKGLEQLIGRLRESGIEVVAHLDIYGPSMGAQIPGSTIEAAGLQVVEPDAAPTPSRKASRK